MPRAIRDLLGRENARRVTVQQEVEPGDFLQFFNRRTGGRERAAGDHRTVIGQQHGVVLVRNGSHVCGVHVGEAGNGHRVSRVQMHDGAGVCAHAP